VLGNVLSQPDSQDDRAAGITDGESFGRLWRFALIGLARRYRSPSQRIARALAAL
jgi:hypothetical protein